VCCEVGHEHIDMIGGQRHFHRVRTVVRDDRLESSFL